MNSSGERKKGSLKDMKENENIDSPFRVPPTPMLKKIGYGTGVGVYRFDRSPRPGNIRSPWALKKMNKRAVRGNICKRLKREAEILKNLDHPNIIGFRAFTSKDGRDILAMEEGGQSLGDMIEKRRELQQPPFTPDEIKKVVKGMCSALHYLHSEHKLIHGDVKSFNILIKDNFKVVKLCDFGVSSPLNDNGEAEDYIGTECWSAPEVLVDGPVTSKADIFSLGLTIWEMLTLEIPHSVVEQDPRNVSFNDDSLGSLDPAENYGTRPKIPDLGEEYDKWVDIFIKCTEEDLTLRPSAFDILNLLQT